MKTGSPLPSLPAMQSLSKGQRRARPSLSVQATGVHYPLKNVRWIVLCVDMIYYTAATLSLYKYSISLCQSISNREWLVSSINQTDFRQYISYGSITNRYQASIVNGLSVRWKKINDSQAISLYNSEHVLEFYEPDWIPDKRVLQRSFMASIRKLSQIKTTCHSKLCNWK